MPKYRITNLWKEDLSVLVPLNRLHVQTMQIEENSFADVDVPEDTDIRSPHSNLIALERKGRVSVVLLDAEPSKEELTVDVAPVPMVDAAVEAAEVVTDNKLVCDKCGFETRSEKKLANHMKSHGE